MLPGPPPREEVLTSALPRSPSLVGPPSREDVLTSALPRPLTLVGPPYREDVVTSALPRPLPVPGDLPSVDYTMQRVADRVDNRSNVYTNSVEQPLLAEFPPPPPVHRQSVPLLSDNTQTTASACVNTDPIPVLSAHRYANIPFDSNYQNISANLLLPTHTNVPTHICAVVAGHSTWAVERYRRA